MSAQDGGAAFPMLGNVGHNSDWMIEHGMSLRDWFAGQALQRLIGYGDPDNTAWEAYRHADAMLAARAAAPPARESGRAE